MFGVLVEYIVGFAIGVEVFWKDKDDEEDPFGYIVVELGIIRLVVSY